MQQRSYCSFFFLEFCFFCYESVFLSIFTTYEFLVILVLVFVQKLLNIFSNPVQLLINELLVKKSCKSGICLKNLNKQKDSYKFLTLENVATHLHNCNFSRL